MSEQNLTIRTKEETKAVFDKMREDAPEYNVKKVSDMPKESGEYTIEIQGVKFIKPLTLKFDGENWVGLEEVMKMEKVGIEKISYYENKPTKKLKK